MYEVHLISLLDVDAAGTSWLLVPFNIGGGQARLVKFSPQGTLLWDRPTIVGNVYPYVLSVDSQERVMVASTTSETSPPYLMNWHIMAYAPNGDELWQDSGTPGYDQYPRAIEFDSQDNAVVTVSYGNYSYQSVIQKYSPQGVIQWSRIYPGNNSIDRYTDLRAIRIDSNDSIFGVGLSNVHTGLVVKYSAQGDFLWSFRHLNRPLYTPKSALAIDNQGTPFLAVTVTNFRYDSLYRVMKLNTQTRRIGIRTLGYSERRDNRINYTLVKQQTREIVEEGEQLAEDGVLSLENVPPGRYLLSFAPVGYLRRVYAIDTTEQEFTSGIPTFFAGDITGDNRVDINDLAAIMHTYNRRSDQPRYNPNADFNIDGVVDIFDLREILRYYNRKGESF